MDIIKYKLELDNARNGVVVKESGYSYRDNPLTSPESITSMMNQLFRLNYQAEEYVYLLCFDSAMHPLGVFEVSHGAFNYASVGIREVFSKALLLCSTSIVLVHNHPSGRINPSDDDKKLLQNLKDASNLLGVSLVDFIIVGGDEFFSAKAEGMI